MNVLLLPKNELSSFVAGLMERYRVVAPVWRNEELRFDEVASPSEAVLNYRNTVKAPKGVLLPQVDCLMRFGQRRDNYNHVQAVPLDEAPTVILGVRPCDARSMVFLDAIFGQGKYTDPYYLARRKNTLVFALACDHPRQTCFCHAFDSGPYDRTGADVFMREAGDAYLIEAVSERGAQALEAAHLATADSRHIDAAQRIEATSLAAMGEIEPVAGIEEVLPSLFNSPLWQEISEKCLACGTCTFVCPTCHCFNIEDRLVAQGGERVRAWDSCQFPIFTLHASGHNPRPDQAARWRQRLLHKFQYLPQNVNLYGCVGCGRCVAACPVCLDIREVVRRVRQEDRAGAKA